MKQPCRAAGSRVVDRRLLPQGRPVVTPSTTWATTPTPTGWRLQWFDNAGKDPNSVAVRSVVLHEQRSSLPVQRAPDRATSVPRSQPVHLLAGEGSAGMSPDESKGDDLSPDLGAGKGFGLRQRTIHQGQLMASGGNMTHERRRPGGRLQTSNATWHVSALLPGLVPACRDAALVGLTAAVVGGRFMTPERVKRVAAVGRRHHRRLPGRHDHLQAGVGTMVPDARPRHRRRLRQPQRCCSPSASC